MISPVLILIGPSGSGKSTCADYLVEQHKFQKFEASRRMTAVVPLGLPQAERLKAIESFLTKNGRDYLGKCIVEDIQAHRGVANPLQRIVISGFRTEEEVDAVRHLFPCLVVGIEASFEVRLSRLASRQRSDYSGSPGAFIRLSAWEYSLGLGRLIYHADRLLVNDRSLPWLYAQTDALVTQQIEDRP